MVTVLSYSLSYYAKNRNNKTRSASAMYMYSYTKRYSPLMCLISSLGKMAPLLCFSPAALIDDGFHWLANDCKTFRLYRIYTRVSNFIDRLSRIWHVLHRGWQHQYRWREQEEGASLVHQQCEGGWSQLKQTNHQLKHFHFHPGNQINMHKQTFYKDATN